MMRTKIAACLIVVGTSLVASPARAAAPDPRFLASSVQSGGSIPVATAIGDVTGDSLPDLIIANGSGDTPATDDTVFVFEQDLSHHTLPSSPSFSVIPSAASNDYKMAVGDLNGDGTGDLAVGIPGVGIDVFLGTGTDLPSLPDVTIAALKLVDLAVGDLNGDGMDDLVSTETASSYDVVLRSQVALGGFTSGTVLAHNVPASGLSLGDVNGDDATDFALDGPYDAPTAPAVYLQDAGLQAFVEHDVTLSTDVTRLFLADVNHDGSSDVVAAEVGGTLGWAIGNGDGTFGPFSSSVGAPQFSAKEVGDLNGDGHDDVATLSTDGTLRVYVQQDGGGLGAPCSFPAPDASGDDTATSIGDLSGEGGPEIAAAEGGGDLGAATVFRQLTGAEALPTSLSLEPSATSTVYGAPVTLTGALSNPAGGCLRTGSVAIHRSGPVGGTVGVGTVPLDPDGSFSTEVTPPSGGTHTYWATWAGDETHDAATSPQVDISVAKVATSLSLTISKQTVVFGNPVMLTAILHGVTTTPKVGFYRIVGGTKTLIGGVHVDGGGVAKLRITPGRNASYQARFLGGAGALPSASSQRSVQVRVVVVSSMVRPVARSNDTAVYNCCKAFYHFLVQPKHPGGTVRVAVQYRSGGRWHPLPSDVDTFTLGSDGTDTIFLHVAGGKGYTFRVRSYFASDGAHLGAWSSYVRFRFR
jgi:Bacterial Ig-like domain (group 3)